MAEHEARAVIFAVVFVAIIIVTAVLLIRAGRPSDTPQFITTLRASFFFWLGISYLLLLLAVAVLYLEIWPGPGPYLFGGILPAAVPWFGAVGAVVISLEGIFAYGQRDWDAKFNYWHIGRPLFGAVLGIIAFFTFVLIVSSAGTVPNFLADPSKSTPHKDFIIYYIVAFLVGYREETFRDLIRRVTDMILKPVTPTGDTPTITFKQNGLPISELDFGTTTANTAVDRTGIEIENTGKASLLVPGIRLDKGTGAAFSITKDQLSNSKELKPGEVKTIDLKFLPTANGAFTSVLSVTGSNLGTAAKLQLIGKA